MQTGSRACVRSVGLIAAASFVIHADVDAAVAVG